jgi:hypothetical protein
MPRACVLIQTDPEKRDAVRNALGRLSMSKHLSRGDGGTSWLRT